MTSTLGTVPPFDFSLTPLYWFLHENHQLCTSPIDLAITAGWQPAGLNTGETETVPTYFRHSDRVYVLLSLLTEYH